jgi:hypothetical protein
MDQTFWKITIANNWSGIRRVDKSVEYRHDDNDFYVEKHVLGEDQDNQQITVRLTGNN